MWRRISVWLAVPMVLVAVHGARAQTSGQDQEPDAPNDDVVISADQLDYDEARNTVTASGNVEVAQGERVLRADRISYDRETSVVTASGNVALLEATGEVLFADYFEITDDLRDGVIKRLSILLTDNSRLVANGGRRIAGKETRMRKAVYSPCKLCEEDPNRAPLWQVKAGTIVHNQESHDITYYDAWLEMFGIPVAYTPYFQHADPTVKRRTGFLTPTYGNSTSLGLELTVPYYWNIAPHRDATFAPRFTTEEGVILAGEYRELTETGHYEFDSSITYTDARNGDGVKTGGDEFRGHFFGSGEFDIDPVWRWGFDVQRATDDTYLRRYRIFSEDVLTTNGVVEGFNERSYAAANVYWFQGLEDGDEDDQIPFILPILDFNYTSEPHYAGGAFSLDGNLMILERINGTDSRRLSLTGGWERRLVSDGGHIFDLSATLRGDLYYVNNLVDVSNPAGETDQDVTGRVRPELILEWRYPLIAYTGTIRQLVEPIVQTIVSPFGGNPEELPNEDSQDFEFDHTNLFSNNRFTGFDRVESGPRVNYGLRLGLYGQGGGRTTLIVGQSARLKEDDTFDAGSGLENRLSDYVGRLFIQPSSFLDFAYRFRIDRSSLAVRRNEVNVTGGPEWLRLAVGYALLEEQIASGGTTTFSNREEVVASGIYRFADAWSLSAGGRRDLTGDGQTINWFGGLTYQDECILVATQLLRSFTRDRDVEPETNFVITIKLTNLG